MHSFLYHWQVSSYLVKALSLTLCFFFILLNPHKAYSKSNVFTYPAPETPNDQRFNDLIEILRTALERTVPEFGPYELGPASTVMSKARYLTELQNGQAPNIIWSSTSQDLENQFLPIRIPLRKGLLGYRIALIAKDQQEKLDRVKTVEDLKKLTVGQGLFWGDSLIFEAVGMQVTRAKYANLFAMTSLKRFDLFPRGINEVFTEYELHRKEFPDLQIEKNLLIYYPWPYYFFFNKNDSVRSKRVETGLRKMMQDGSFEAIFRKYHNSAIEQADLKNRRIIRLKNTLLPKETPLHDSSLWFNPVLP